MKKLTSKERVLRALNHQETDRVPIDLGGQACCLVDESYFKLKEYLQISGAVEPFRKGANCCYYDESVLDALEIDIRRVIAKPNPDFPKALADGSFVNEWSLIQRQGDFGIETIKHPLQNASIEDLKYFHWPKAVDMLDITGLKDKAEKLHEENTYAISLRAPMNGIFEIACWLRGMQEFMVDMLEQEEFAHALLDQVLAVEMDYYGLLLDEVGPYVDIVETGDDYGGQESLLMSPECLREFILGRRKKLNEMIRKKAPMCKIFLHCCGSIKKCIPDLIACGVDILNPVQTNAVDMNPYDLKSNFGDQICFHGGIDTQKAMRGSNDMVREEVNGMLTAMHQDGGYILSCCNHIQKDIPIENIIAMFEYAKELSAKSFNEL